MSEKSGMQAAGSASTLEKIQAAAMKEFREKGFQKASLRNIVKEAGVTTGAFYGYYDSKEALFDDLVGRHADYVISLFDRAITDFEALTDEEQTEKMLQVSGGGMKAMVEYVYEHYDAFKLLMGGAYGTAYENFIHELVEKEVDSTYFYMETLKRQGHVCPPINRKLIHMIASGQFTGVFEAIVHDMPKDEAMEYIAQFRKFYSAGWEALMNVKFGEEGSLWEEQEKKNEKYEQN